LNKTNSIVEKNKTQEKAAGQAEVLAQEYATKWETWPNKSTEEERLYSTTYAKKEGTLKKKIQITNSKPQAPGIDGKKLDE